MDDFNNGPHTSISHTSRRRWSMDAYHSSSSSSSRSDDGAPCGTPQDEWKTWTQHDQQEQEQKQQEEESNQGEAVGDSSLWTQAHVESHSDAVSHDANNAAAGFSLSEHGGKATARVASQLRLVADGDQKMEDSETTAVHGGDDDDIVMTTPAHANEEEDARVDNGSSMSGNPDDRSSRMDVDTGSQRSMRKWIHAIQNESYQPKPTAYSPQGRLEEDPLLEQQRQCQDKLDALRQVRARVQFFPLANVAKKHALSRTTEPRSMSIQTRMILSKLEGDDIGDAASNGGLESIGIEALSGLEILFLTYLTHAELIRASEVCRSWTAMARHDLIWEPMLYTPCERYPLREFLGLGKDLPAIQVFMIFKRLRLTELPIEVDTRSSDEMRRNLPAHRGRLAEERERFQTWLRTREDQPAHAVPEQSRSALLQHGDRSRSKPIVKKPVESMHLVCFHGENPTTDAYEWPTAVNHLQDQFPGLFATNHGRTEREEEEVDFVKDGYRRITLKLWQQQQKTISEHTLRSFLRQMLLAIDALERSGVVHSDISMMNIVVLERASGESMHSKSGVDGCGNAETSPVFQLLCSLNTWYFSEFDTASVAPQGDGGRLEDDIMHRGRREDENADEEGHGLLHLVHAVFQTRLRPPCMLTSLFRCAISLWSRGRFADTIQHNSMPLLTLLAALHAHIPAGFRSFVEYGKFLLHSGTPSAARMLNHAFVATGANARSVIPIRAIQTQDVHDYQASILAWYGNAQTCTQATEDSAVEHLRTVGSRGKSGLHSSADTLPNDLMPRTQMGASYFQHALDESKLPRERFVSVVAPVVKSSSWVRSLAETQRHTLQRLDLSNVMLPTSVLLKELVKLPRITHLRLPSNIERPDDLEHFLAALSCTDLLPNLRAMDENVKLAMDRIEKTYVDQLGMVDFLLNR